VSTLLELFQDTVRECGITTEKPSTVLNQTGELLQVLHWISDAYVELQRLRNGNWLWLKREFTLNTVAEDDTYAYGDCIDVLTGAAIDRFRDWCLDDPYDPPRIYLQSAGESTKTRMTSIRFHEYRSLYGGSSQSSAFPQFIAVDNDKNLKLGNKPNDVYVVSSWFKRGPQVLAFNEESDNEVTPEMPDHHELIVYGAMKKYAFFNSAQEFMDRAVMESKPSMKALERSQLPSMRGARPLA
jgi:hypothetical protein